MTLSKVSVIWRIGFLIVLGAIIGTFMTIAIITKRLETGDTVNIGKIKIKNASNIEMPFIITPSDPDWDEGKDELTRKEKRQKRRDK